MLAYILALAVGLGSITFYIAAFFFPEVHRKNDFLWSGVGFFYALVLWFCAGRITGGVLLGQMASVTLLGWFAWQTLVLRRQLIPVEQQTEVPSKEKLQEQLSNLTPPAAVSQPSGGATNLFKNAFGRVGKIGGIGKPKAKPPAEPSQPEVAVTPPEPSGENPQVETIATIEIVPDTSVTPDVTSSEAVSTVETSSLGTEPTPVSTQPAGPDMPDATPVDPAPIAEVAPEVELAPPAEPVGDGDPGDRQITAQAGILRESASLTSEEAEATSEIETPALERPHPPAPEVVEAAVEDAQEKGMPASPPETEA